jgi:serine/threonine-protein kinase
MPVTRPALPPRYATPEPIASGGMGEVYRATDSILRRTVAVKVLSGRWAGHDEFNARFLREARTAASLSGEPHIISIYDVSETADGLPFIVMEYARRGTVGDRLERGALPPEQTLRWLEQAGGALDRAHARGVVHRDVKPANLLIADDETIRVSDFGIARAADQDTLTEVGSVLGSAGYMAPEQARGEPTSPASDRYALACVAFECLTGRRPFERESQAAEAAAHAHEPPPSIHRLEPSLPAALEAVFARGLAKAPDERYPTCASLVSDLRAALATAPAAAATIVARPAPMTVHRSRRYGRKGRGLLLAAGALGLLAAGGVAALALGGDGNPESATVVLTQTVEGQERTVVVTQTTEGATVERTVTAEGSEAAGPPPSSGNASESGTALNDRGFRLLQAGDPRAALPLLE